LKPEEGANIDKLLNSAQSPTTQRAQVAEAPQNAESAQEPATGAGQHSAKTERELSSDTEDVPDEAVSAYLAQNAAEIAGGQSKTFQPVGGLLALSVEDDSGSESAAESATGGTSGAASGQAGAAAAPARSKPVAETQPGHRDNALQKINKLDIKGRIQLALKGNKEERSLLIRDGTKVVALAVLEAPKLSDGEVEKYALQKNVLEAVLRQIPLKRRFMKNYIVVRNLVANPRTPLDLSLGLMKHLLAQDLKNLSANKEVSETVRKLALKMYKQKLESASKK
jgi:hypothetical protein